LESSFEAKDSKEVLDEKDEDEAGQIKLFEPVKQKID